MRALTLTQPWAGLVAAGIKLVENRSFSMIKREDFGVPFALHAGKLPNAAVYDAIARIDPSCDVRELAADTPWVRLSRVTSAVIGVATVERVVVAQQRGDQVLDRQSGELVDLGDQRRWFFGPVGYVLRDARALAVPVPCRGWQGFWTLPADVEAQVRAQLEAAA